jgi:hypothetical protein
MRVTGRYDQSGVTVRLSHSRILGLPAALVLAALFAAPLPVFAQAEQTDRPVPEIHAFLEEVRKHFHSDDYLLEQYTFTERRTERRFDAKGRVKQEKHEVYEVYPSAASRHTYRRLVQRDGHPVSTEELAKQDRKHEKRVARSLEAGEAAEARRRERKAESERREREVVDEIFHVYDVAIVGRETIEGRPTLLVTFQPRTEVKPTSRRGRIFQKFSGRAWVDEEDYQVVRAEAELKHNLSFGLGVLARLHEGATASFRRRKVNGEVWLPAEASFRGSAHVLLVKGVRIDSRSEYSDYKKFNVATEETVEAEKTSE